MSGLGETGDVQIFNGTHAEALWETGFMTWRNSRQCLDLVSTQAGKVQSPVDEVRNVVNKGRARFCRLSQTLGNCPGPIIPHREGQDLSLCALKVNPWIAGSLLAC